MELLDKDKKFVRKYEYNKFVFDYLSGFIGLLQGVFFAVIIETVIPNIIGAILFTIIGFISIFTPIFAINRIKRKEEKIFYLHHGMSEQEASIHYSGLLNIKSLFFYIPIIFHRFCELNSDARSTQIESLKRWYIIDDKTISDYIINREYSEEDWNKAVEQLKEEEFDTKKSFIHRLFQLSILEDGIHNDEWNLMMQLITDLRFNKNYINYFKDRYNPLRTEFDESEWKGNSSTTYVLASPKEYYNVLGLSEGASYEEIKRAYHELALQHHPDLPKNAGRTEECEKMMMKINEAYEKLRSKS